MDVNALSKEIIGAAMQVHRALGPGLLEGAYEACLAHELTTRELINFNVTILQHGIRRVVLGLPE